MYEELKDKNFVIIAAAQDTGGEKAAGKFYDQAKVTFPALIDTHHEISSLYHMVNVPMGVWINEEGRMVRPVEVAYSHKVQFDRIKVDGDSYVKGLRDWIEKGDKSKYALSPKELRERTAAPDSKGLLADANFKLGVYFHEQGKKALAKKYWQEAERLNPDSWNYHRQDWSFTPDKAMEYFMKKFRAEKDKDYYPPLRLP